jgi:hypothetical protein
MCSSRAALALDAVPFRLSFLRLNVIDPVGSNTVLSWLEGRW